MTADDYWDERDNAMIDHYLLFGRDQEVLDDAELVWFDERGKDTE